LLCKSGESPAVRILIFTDDKMAFLNDLKEIILRNYLFVSDDRLKSINFLVSGLIVGFGFIKPEKIAKTL